MGAIVDTLILGLEEIVLVIARYPQSVIKNLRDEMDLVSQFRVVIGDEDEESYYDFLVSSCIAMSSKKFCARFKTDKAFATRMEPKIWPQRPLG